jgi:HK97 family phage major capsid protein
MQKLIDKRIALLNECQTIATRAKESGAALSPEDHAKVAANFAECDALEKTIGEIRRVDEAVRAAAPAVAPSLADGAPRAEYRTLRGIDGREHRVYQPKQRMASFNTGTDGMTLAEFGEGVAAMISGDTHRHRAEVRALTSSVNTQGGILIAEELSSQLVDLSRDKAVMFAAGAQTVAMNSSDLRLVRLATDPTVTETGEGVAITASDPSFDSILLVAKKLATITSVTNELLADAGNAGEAIVDALSNAMAGAMDEFILARLLESTQIGTEAGVGAISYQDLLAARLAVSVLNGESPTCVCNPNLPYDLSLLTEATTNAFLAAPPALSDLRYITSNRVDADTAIVGDFSKVIVGIRQGITLAMSSEADDAMSKDLTYMRAIMRLDANVLRPHFRILAGIS